MSSVRFTLPLILALAALTAPTQTAVGQVVVAAPTSRLDSCIAAANRRDYVTAERIADAGVRLLNDSLSRRPADAELLVSIARLISQCRMPGADQMRLGELSGETIDLLTRALARDSTHWLARYLLSLQYYRSPDFLGRAGLAANEFDRLIAQQGTRRAPAMFARPFEYRGTLWMRVDKSDSARAVWMRGLELFPADSALQQHVRALKVPAPAPPAGAPLAVTRVPRVPLAETADTLFWRTLHAGAYDSIPRALLVMMAAYLQNPADAETAAHVAFLHAWHIAERSRLAEVSPAITDDAILARRYFDQSMAHAPRYDARIHGFDAVLRMIEGDIHRDAELWTDGLGRGREAIKAWPEFNWFTIGYVLSAKPDTSAIFREALEMQWKTVNACGRTTVDRVNPTAEVALAALRTETDPLRLRACTNGWIAPHNMEGFFLNMGDMVVKSGDWRAAQKVYELARGTRGVGDYATWPYREVLETRIRDAEQNVRAFQRGSTPLMFGSTFACSACHQTGPR